MKILIQEKKNAIKLRKKGYSYKEILKEVPVAKSSLSLWLKDLPLTSAEKGVLKKRKDQNISRGRIKAAAVLRQNRLDREKQWLSEAECVFEKYRGETLFHTGIALYWAEGGKRTNQFQFSNSDADMINIMLLWLEKYHSVARTNLRYRIYAHKAYAHENIEKWWIQFLNLQNADFGKMTCKPTTFDYKKRPNYKGCFRIEVPKSKGLLCKMKFWTNMMVEQYKEQ